MITRASPSPTPEQTPTQPTRLVAGLCLLRESGHYAESLHRDAWDFAVEVGSLRAAGLTNSDLRWLACRGYVVHAVETTRPGKDRRSFHRDGLLTFGDKTCLVLTPAGEQFAARVGATSPLPGPAPLPRWDAERRELRVGDVLVKKFKVPARNQELVLTAFAEERWPVRIDDPLPPRLEVDPKRRLVETISRLNRNQKHRVLRFHGDGHGEGISWELLQ